MLTEEDKKFMAYWEANRTKKKKVFRQLSVGLPVSVAIVVGIFANVISGWYTRAEKAMSKQNASLILVLIVAAILIVIFFVVFSARHRWDLNEQHYNELASKAERP